jgi:hypothetical protein
LRVLFVMDSHVFSFFFALVPSPHFPLLTPGGRQACRAAQPIEELNSMGAFETVARLTGGVPRQIHHMLAALILSGTKLQPATVK